LSDISAAMGEKLETIRGIIFRDELQLVSQAPGAGRIGRKFCLLDIEAIAIYHALKSATKIPVPKLVSEMSHALFGDPMSEAEMRDRRATVIEDRVRSKRRGTLGKHDKLLFRLHEHRREELLADMFAANSLWWARDPDRHYSCSSRTRVNS
jgi:hypothetical protein